MDEATARVSKVVHQISLLGMNVYFMFHNAVVWKEHLVHYKSSTKYSSFTGWCTFEFGWTVFIIIFI